VDSPSRCLNTFAEGLNPLDMTPLDEFSSLLQSAKELGISHGEGIQYRSRNTVVRQQRFHFLEWGQPGRPPVIVLHGGNQSAHSWDLVSLHLAERYHVFALDQRGHGDSEWSRAADYSIGAMAQDLEAFIEGEGIESPVILGHSMGGMVTLAFAVRRPSAARALGIVDVGPELNAAGTQIIGEFVHHNVEFDDMEEFLDRVEQYDPYRTRAHMERTLKYNLLRRADDRFVSKTDRRRFAPPGDGTPGRLHGVPNLEGLRAIDVPTLIFRGAASEVLLPDAAEAFAAVLPNGRLSTIADCGHNVHSQNTLGFLAELDPFVASVTSG